MEATGAELGDHRCLPAREIVEHEPQVAFVPSQHCGEAVGAGLLVTRELEPAELPVCDTSYVLDWPPPSRGRAPVPEHVRAPSQVVWCGTGSGKTEAFTRVLSRLIGDAASASGVSRREIRVVFPEPFFVDVIPAFRFDADATFVRQAHLREDSVGGWTVDRSDAGRGGLCGGPGVCPALVSPARIVLQAGCQASARVSVLFLPVDPVAALLVFLQKLIHLGRRADVSRQLALQRLKLVCRAARSSPDVPPGEVVVSSACVPRGPDLLRVVSTFMSTNRGDRLALV